MMLRRQKGFSLIELMITVAIIGMLASLAGATYEQMLGRARQAEAKVALSAMYEAEKSFYAEHSSYTECLTAAGYSMDSSQRYYLTGFWAGDTGACAGNQTCYASSWNPVVYCDCTCGPYDATGANNATFSNTIVADPALPLLNSCASGDSQGVPFAWTVTTETFVVGAYGSIINNGKWDAWQVDQNKNMTHIIDGL